MHCATFSVFATLAAGVLGAPAPENVLEKRLFGLTPTTTTSTAAATPTATPTAVYTGLASIVTSSDLISTSQLSAYSVSACQALCAANSRCVFFDVYTQTPFLNIFATPSSQCALYSQQHAWYDATDSGSVLGYTYSNSGGYVMPGQTLTVATGTTAVKPATATSTIAAVTSSVAAAVAATTSSVVAAVTSSSKAATTSSTAAVVAAVTSSAAAAVNPSPVGLLIGGVVPTTSSTPAVVAAVTSSSVALVVVAATSSAAAVVSSVAAVVTSSSTAPAPAVTTSTTAANVGIAIGTVVAGTTSSAAAAVVAATTSSAAAAVAAVTSQTTQVAAATSAAAAAVAAVTTSKSSTTTSTTAAAAATTSSTACTLPNFAYPGWCKVSTALVQKITAAAANPSSLSTGIIIPLYIYPSWWTTPGAWDWVVNAAQQYPSMPFVVVVNPASGPGSSAVPNSDYVHEIARLNALSNVQLLGYVDTAYGSRLLTDVLNDVSVYGGWGSSNPSIALDGVFFDNAASTATYLAQYTSYATAVRANSGFAGTRLVALAPGQICNPQYVDIADIVVIYEQGSANVQANLFGWYQSFYQSLSAAQMSKISWLVNAADQTTQQAVQNLQAAFNTPYLFVTDMSGWQTFVTQPSTTVFSKVLQMLANPLYQADTALVTKG